ncbi:MAG: hypothetical protein V1721_03430 [Pseudomonadota bacterium]
MQTEKKRLGDDFDPKPKIVLEKDTDILASMTGGLEQTAKKQYAAYRQGGFRQQDRFISIPLLSKTKEEVGALEKTSGFRAFLTACAKAGTGGVKVYTTPSDENHPSMLVIDVADVFGSSPYASKVRKHTPKSYLPEK